MKYLFRICFFFSALTFATACSQEKNQSSDQMADATRAPASDDAALQAANAAIEKEPGSAANLRKRAGLYLDRKEYDLALNDINKALSIDSTKSEFHYVRARALRGKSQVPAALKAALNAERKGSTSPELFLSMGEMFLILKQYQKSIDYLNKSLINAPFNEQAYFYKGLVYAESGDTTRAISSLQTAVEQAPNYTDAYNALIKIYNAKKEKAMAEQYLKSGMRFSPEDPYLWFNQGVMFRNAGKTDTAMASFRYALQYDSTNYLARYLLGTLAYEKENYEVAAQQLQRAYQRDRTLPGIEALLAYSYEQLGQTDKARQFYQAAAAKSPGDEEIRKGINRLDAAAAGGNRKP